MMTPRNSSSCPRLIETDEFPFEFLSDVAERESWRKEIYRPVYHLHKWWAKRLGSVFRGIIIGCNLPEGARLEDAFYSKRSFPGVVVVDPFMGSGTTIGEAHKLGCIAFGQDINPVACESVRVSLGPLNRQNLLEAFALLSCTVGERVRNLYLAEDDQGQICDVLYYFWVKTLPCPRCETIVDLFSSRIIARNACPERKPEVQICCPGCDAIFPAASAHARARCPDCGLDFDPHEGTANGTKAYCRHCLHEFPIAEAVRAVPAPPKHRLYAKLLLTPDGKKRYLPATVEDIRQYEECEALFEAEWRSGKIRVPDAELSDGYNTRQAIGYNYRRWRDFFNKRQLLALGWLQQSISELCDPRTRDAFLTLFSGLLEFNNMFASYKGEGTGAVRHMFSHHILKPERTPIEANVWGTPRSSGSFSGLFKTRLLRLVEYRDAPFEVQAKGKGKRYHASPPFSGEIEMSWPRSDEFKARGVYLSCGSSDHMTLSDKSVDAVVTDPPFFDNVHYSELADFFYAWQSLYPRGFIDGKSTTRHPREVQDARAAQFSDKLRNVLRECHRILKDEGILSFTYHHSRSEGWTALASALFEAGFAIVNAHPVKAEMSVAAPKSQSKDPIQLDIVLVCRKRRHETPGDIAPEAIVERAIELAGAKAARLARIGLKLSRGDCRVILISQFLAEVSSMAVGDAIEALKTYQASLEEAAEQIRVTDGLADVTISSAPGQKELPFAQP